MFSLFSLNLVGKPPHAALSTETLIQRGFTSADGWRPCPIEPAWIRRGDPVARSVPLARADDGGFSCGLWDCTAGQFDYTFFCDEIVHILEGEVIVREAGAVHTLRPGDVAFFPKGLTANWTVPVYVKKFAVFRSVRPSLVRRVVGKLKRLILGRG